MTNIFFAKLFFIVMLIVVIGIFIRDLITRSFSVGYELKPTKSRYTMKERPVGYIANMIVLTGLILLILYYLTRLF